MCDPVIPGTAVTAVVKAASEQRYTLGVAFPALRPEVRKAVDGKRDIIGPAAIEKTAWDWMQKHRQVGLYHMDRTMGHGTVVESYIYRGPDWRLVAVDGSVQVIKAGDWLVGTVWDEDAWALVKRGLINGFSPQGAGRRRPASPDLEVARS